MNARATRDTPGILVTAALAAMALLLTGACGDEPTTTQTTGTPDATTQNDTFTPGQDTTTTPDPGVDAGEPPLGPPPPGGKCDYVAIAQDGGKAFGEGCTSNTECAWGECLQTTEGGNVTNEVFGFCTRGCDCGTTETTLSSEEKEGLMCIYPTGNQRKWAHVVVRCGSLADCTALDPRWTDCRLPSEGGVQAVCHADLE